VFGDPEIAKSRIGEAQGFILDFQKQYFRFAVPYQSGRIGKPPLSERSFTGRFLFSEELDELGLSALSITSTSNGSCKAGKFLPSRSSNPESLSRSARERAVKTGDSQNSFSRCRPMKQMNLPDYRRRYHLGFAYRS
jgi:hypothetical protein